MLLRRVGLALALGLYIWGAVLCHRGEEYARKTDIALETGVDAVRAEEIFTQDAEGLGLCFWGVGDTQTVQCRETGTQARVTRVFLRGNAQLLGVGILFWQEGCVLDEATARTLFGTEHCGGQLLWQGDSCYRVLDTLPLAQPTLVTLASPEDGAVLNRCLMDVPPERGEQAASQLLLRWELSGQRLDVYPLWVANHNLLVLEAVAWLVYGTGRRRSKAGAILSFLIALGLLACLLRFVPGMFPSRWSDFSFWGRLLAGQRENARRVLLTPMAERYLQLGTNMVKSMVSSTAALVLAAWVQRRHRHAHPAD